MDKTSNNSQLYHDIIITKKINIPFSKLGKNIEDFFIHYAKKYIEGRCQKEGYIKKNSLNIVSYSAGVLNDINVEFDVIFQGLACYPCENMEIDCIITNITNIGIKAIISKDENPLIIFLSKEHNNISDYSKFDINQKIRIRILGIRFELNDLYICAISEFVNK
jgi:DNA-directed RNA polymerase subunit E'/Rpb7